MMRKLQQFVLLAVFLAACRQETATVGTSAPNPASAPDPVATPAYTPSPEALAAGDPVPMPTLQVPATGTVDTIMRRPAAEQTVPQMVTESYPPRVTAERARQLVDAGQGVIVDVRAPEYYRERHIAGSINIPLGDVVTRMAELPEGKTIITACT